MSILQDWPSNETPIEKGTSLESKVNSDCKALPKKCKTVKSIPAPVHRLGRGTSGEEKEQSDVFFLGRLPLDRWNDFPSLCLQGFWCVQNQPWLESSFQKTLESIP